MPQTVSGFAAGWFVVVGCLVGIVGAATPTASGAETNAPRQRIVVLQHAEKPPMGFGQLTCQGLNRALLLPDFLAKNFPAPDFIFAPDPSVKCTEIHGDGQRYDYVRPLLTIAPTAVRLGMPIDTQLPFNDPGLLADTLLQSRYRDATIYVAWEHANIVTFAEILLKRFGSSQEVPEWPNSDYGTIFDFTIEWADPPTLQMQVRSQNFDTISDRCPTAAE